MRRWTGLRSHPALHCGSRVVLFAPLPLPPDYSYYYNVSDSDGPPTTYLPEDFTYYPSQLCPERLPSMSKCTLRVFPDEQM